MKADLKGLSTSQVALQRTWMSLLAGEMLSGMMGIQGILWAVIPPVCPAALTS